MNSVPGQLQQDGGMYVKSAAHRLLEGRPGEVDGDSGDGTEVHGDRWRGDGNGEVEGERMLKDKRRRMTNGQ